MEPLIQELSTEVRAFVEANKEETLDIKARLTGIEQRITAPRGDGIAGETESLGHKIICSAEFKEFLSRGMKSSGRIPVQSFFTKTALVNADGQNQPLVPPVRYSGIIGPGQQRLTIRDLLPVTPVAGNLVEFGRETSFDNQAAPQGASASPAARENVNKAESAMAFELAHTPVQTLAHWIPVSRQLMDDAPGFAAYLNARMLFGLKLVEEGELLNGDGTNNSLDGLVNNSTAYDTAQDGGSDTQVDTVRHAITQVALSDYEASAIIVHPTDWEKIELLKTTGTSSSGEYISTNPRIANPPALWGLPVVATKSMSQGEFLVGAFNQAAMIWDRMAATVELSREHSDYFTRNMVAVLCEERIAVSVFREKALVHGTFPQSA